LTRLFISGAAGIGLILLLALVVTRLIRSRRRGLSVRMQIFLALAAIVGAFSFGLGLLVVDRVEARAERLAVAAAQDEAHAVAAVLRSEMKRAGVSFGVLARELAERNTELTRAESPYAELGELGIELLDPEGKLVFPAGGKSRAQEEGSVFVDAAVNNQGTKAGTVRVVKPTIAVQAMLADFAPTVLVISLVLGAAAAGAAAWIGRTIAEPIESLSHYSQRVSGGERADLPREVTGREVARLVASIDTMKRRLEGRPFVETFAADLSHELKNPVAAIRASAEVLLEGALEEPAEARRFVERIHEAADRITKLLAELLSLAQVEARGAEHREKVLMGPLIVKLVSNYPPEVEKRINLQIDEHIATKGDRGWLARAISNMIDNALLHSPEASTVTVELVAKGSHLIVITDNPGFIDEHIQRSLFRRFVTTRREQGGTGLGLSIVQAVAEAHHGQIELKSGGPEHVRFQLRLPLA
jgi:two-component system sensor histidine kinase CreC